MRTVEVTLQGAVFKNCKFHCWGQEGVESKDGNMQFTVGIIELDDGGVISVMPKFINFVDVPEDEKFKTAIQQRNSFIKMEHERWGIMNSLDNGKVIDRIIKTIADCDDAISRIT